MNERQPLTDIDLIQEELVSYLDGELDADSSALVEHRLSEDETYRMQLQQLQQTWDILDHLPRSHVPESFAKTTVEMVAVRETDNSQAKRGPRRFSWLPTVAGFAAAMAIGYLLVSWGAHRTEKELLADLPIIQNIDMYRYAESIGFLRRLEETRLFTAEVEDDEEIAPEELNLTLPIATQNARQAFQALPAAEKVKLNRQKERFDQIKDDEKSHLRQLHRNLNDDPNSNRLQEVMIQYSSWLSALSSAERAEHLSKTEDERIKDIKKSVQNRQKESFRRMLKLSDEDMKKTNQWFDNFLERHKEEIVEALPSRLPQYIKEEPDPTKRRLMQYGLLMKMFMQRRYQQNRDADPNEPPILIPRPSQEEVNALIKSLSDQGQKILQKFPTESGFNVSHRLIGAAVFCRLKPSEKQRIDELRKFFLGLPDKRRRELLSLPPEAMQRELRSEFRDHRYRQNYGGERSGPPRGKRGRGKGSRSPFSGPPRHPNHRRGGEGPPPGDFPDKRRGDSPPPRKSPPPTESSAASQSPVRGN